MSCNRLVRSARPAPVWHRWRCAECRTGHRADSIIDLGLACLRAESEAADRLGQVLEAMGLEARPALAARIRVRRLVRRIARLVIAAVGALVVACGAWLWLIDRDPAAPVPSQAMPRGNAITYFRDAAALMRYGPEIDAAAASRPGPRANGLWSPPAGSSAPAARGAPGLASQHLYTLTEKAGLVAANGPALARLREGLRHPYLEPPARSFSAVFPHYSDDRRLARLLVLDAQVEAGRGNTAAAIGSCLDAMQLGVRVPHGGILIGRLVGIACEQIGRNEAWNLVSHLSGPAARGAASRLARLQADRVPLADTLTEEKWLTVAGLQEVFRTRGWRWDGTLGLGGTENSPALGMWRFATLLPYSKRQILDNYARAMDAQIDRARHRYADQSSVHVRVPQDPVNRILFPVFSEADCKDADDEAQNSLLLAALALRAYHMEHGAYPGALAELAPTYLSAVPSDPFAPSDSPVRYVRLGDRYALYSVGPDGVDNGGNPIKSAFPGHGDESAGVSSESVGDIVAQTGG